MRWSPRCTVLGPGTRAVLWVQGCPFRCSGCVVPESLPFEGGEEVEVEQIARRVLSLADVDGLTLSGGEPMSQAGPLCRLIDGLLEERDLSIMCYTGHTIEGLAARGSAAQLGLLRRVDILVDGPYIPSRHTDLRWRGSDNQRVLFLTGRHRDWSGRIDERGRWLEFEVAGDGVAWMGIPPPGFRRAFARAMEGRGVVLEQEGSGP